MYRTIDTIKAEIAHYKNIKYYLEYWDMQRLNQKIAELAEELRVAMDIELSLDEPWRDNT